MLAREHLAKGDAVGWFEPLYRDAGGDIEQVPWAKKEPNPWLVRWLRAHPPKPASRALVIGCGLGDDAEVLLDAGCEVTAVDVADTAIRWCRERFPDSAVNYRVADMFDPPAGMTTAFDLVYDAYTVQSLPLAMRERTLAQLVRFAAPGGKLLLICFACADGAVPDGPPWPVSRLDLQWLEEQGLALDRFEDFSVPHLPGRRRFVAQYRLRLPRAADTIPGRDGLDSPVPSRFDEIHITHADGVEHPGAGAPEQDDNDDA